jgi:Flp pilus assembly protein TadG
MRFLRRFRREESGQSAVEFALVMPLLLLFLVGIIEFGRGWNDHQVITDAAREAARKCVISDNATTTTAVENVAKNALSAAGINPAPPVAITVAPAFVAGAQPTGTPCTVSIQLPYTFTFLGPLMRWTTGQRTVNLRTTFTMRFE